MTSSTKFISQKPSFERDFRSISESHTRHLPSSPQLLSPETCTRGLARRDVSNTYPN